MGLLDNVGYGAIQAVRRKQYFCGFSFLHGCQLNWVASGLGVVNTCHVHSSRIRADHASISPYAFRFLNGDPAFQSWPCRTIRKLPPQLPKIYKACTLNTEAEGRTESSDVVGDTILRSSATAEDLRLHVDPSVDPESQGS